MSSIPLPALDVKPPQQQDTMGQLANLLALKNQIQEAPLRQQAMQQQIAAGQQENQMRALQLKDQQAMTAAMQQWDGKDVNSLVPLVIKNGASAQAVMGLKSKVLEQQQAYSKIAADDATTGAKNLETLKGKNDLVAGAIGTVMQMPDNQIAQGLVSTAQDLAQKGLIDPQHAQIAEQMAQSGNPAQIRQQLSLFQKGYMAQSQQMDAALKTAQTGEANSRAHEADVNAQRAQTEMQLGTGPMADSRYRNILMAEKLGRPVTPEDQAFKAAYEKQKLLVPAATANIRLEGYAQSRQLPVYDNQQKITRYVSADELNRAAAEQPGRYTVASYTPEAIGARDTTKYMTSGKGGQQITAFNTAMNHLDTLDKLAADLGNSNVQVFNKAAQAWAEQTGNPAPVNFDAAKNAMAGEVAAALKASGATDQEIAKVDQTFSRAQSPMQLKGAISTYRTLLKGKESNLQQQYQQGMQGKPNFQGSAASPSGLSVKAPNGKTYTFRDQASADAFKKSAGIP